MDSEYPFGLPIGIVNYCTQLEDGQLVRVLCFENYAKVKFTYDGRVESYVDLIRQLRDDLTDLLKDLSL